MEKLRKVIEQYGRWSAYSLYVDRIEAHVVSDFSLCIENSKSLIEGISKQICKEKGIEVAADISFNKLIKMAFDVLGYKPGEHVNVISGSLSAIAQQLGNLRTNLGSTAHGKTIEELNARNEALDLLTKEFLIDTIEILTCFLIRNFENENPRTPTEQEESVLSYWEAEDFNEFWDDAYGEFPMGNYAYTASEILYNVDKQAYINEYRAYKLGETTLE